MSQLPHGRVPAAITRALSDDEQDVLRTSSPSQRFVRVNRDGEAVILDCNGARPVDLRTHRPGP